MAGVMLTGVVLTGVLTAGASGAQASASACPAGQITGSAATPTGAGYWLVDSGGDVFSFGAEAMPGQLDRWRRLLRLRPLGLLAGLRQ